MDAPQPLVPGTAVILAPEGRTGRIVRFIGAGGQGGVYEVETGSGRLALKLYHPHSVMADARLPARLDQAILKGAPGDGFLWPISRASIADDPSRIGYVMPFRPDRFVGMKALIAAPPARINPTMEDRACACLLIAESFHRLHAAGLCYQDVSFGNIFIDPANGDIAICDNDNVDVNGAPPAVFGTRKFMAPEIVRREATPSTQTDLYSMAVLFFYILLSWHPLDGRREQEAALLDVETEERLYGHAPLFLFDPADPSNGPVDGFHDPLVRRWRSLSPHLRALLTRAFTSGLKPGPARVLETEWINAFSAMRDRIVCCPACGYEHGADGDDADPDPGRFACLACGTTLPAAASIVAGRLALPVTSGRKIRADRIAAVAGRDRNAVIGVIEARPGAPGVHGLRNLSAASWTASYPDGRVVDIAPNRVGLVVPGTTFTIGAVVLTSMASADAALGTAP